LFLALSDLAVGTGLSNRPSEPAGKRTHRRHSFARCRMPTTRRVRFPTGQALTSCAAGLSGSW